MDHYNDWKRYADETLSAAREFTGRERLARQASTLEVGQLPTWLVIALVLVFVGLLVLAL